MAKSTISICIDEDFKKRVESLADTFGMNLTTLVTVFLRTVERERRIPFEISADSQNPEV
ncbi:MAG: type II toxin-antitoxin system RelB/DinJ family antitoxin [Oscillospiraceae bacterium]|nr:type II toxin-antitoxin system RelB/DinJ family antitoxin [Oscillospiraceae bacterium]